MPMSHGICMSAAYNARTVNRAAGPNATDPPATSFFPCFFLIFGRTEWQFIRKKLEKIERKCVLCEQTD